MYRNYQEYEKDFAERIVPFISAVGKAPRKKSVEEFNRENYRDKVEWYLCAEWSVESLADVFYGDCDLEDDSDYMTPEEERGDELHSGVYEIVENGYNNGECVNQTAYAVYEYLKKESVI